MKKYFINSLALITVFTTLASIAFAQQTNYQEDIKKWREKHETELKSEDSWLTLTGLFWLKEGINTVGSQSGSDIELPAVSGADKVGSIEFKQNVATLRVNPGVPLEADGKQAIGDLELAPDASGKPTILKIGDVSFTLIKREDRYGIRVKNKNNEARRNFKGLHWYAPDKNYLVTARFVAYDKPKEILIPNVLGSNFKMQSPGLLVFKIKGKEYKLEPVQEGEQLFIIFRDRTSRTTTYGAGRFVYADKPVNGIVQLDFNKAYNPPCAFTTFATCPLPPPQNRLSALIPVGEKKYH